MKKLEFTAEDFMFSPNGPGVLAFEACRMANARLAEMLKDAKVVYGKLDPWHSSFSTNKDLPYQDGSKATHRALLINVEELAPEPCRHPKELITVNGNRDPAGWSFFCNGCKRWLNPNWTVND